MRKMFKFSKSYEPNFFYSKNRAFLGLKKILVRFFFNSIFRVQKIKKF